MEADGDSAGAKLEAMVDGMVQEQAVLIAGPIAELMRILAAMQLDLIERIGKVSKRLGSLIDRKQEELRLLLRNVVEEAMIKGVY